MNIRLTAVLSISALSLWMVACSDDSDDTGPGDGGTTSTGGSADGGTTSSGGSASGGTSNSGGTGMGAQGGDDSVGGVAGMGGDDSMGGMGGMGGNGPTPPTLAEACAARCATTTSIGCAGNEDLPACVSECKMVSAVGCETEWYELKVCESELDATGFQCINMGMSFIGLSLAGQAACGDEVTAELACYSDSQP